MLLEQLAGNLTQGLLLGAVYGVATMGLSLIFGVLRVVNVGHGAFIMAGAFITYWLFVLLGLPPPASIPIALVIGIALGLVFFYLIMRRLVGAPELATLLATFAIGILLEEVAKVLWGSEFRGFNWALGKIALPITVIPLTKLYAFLGAIAIAVLVYLWFKKTRAGTAIRTVVEDAEGARVCGVNVGRVYGTSFAVGIGLTVMSGVLLTMFIPVGINPYMGAGYTLKAFVIAVLGGLTSPWGAFYAGLIFGLVENGSYTLFSLLPNVEPFALTRFLSFAILLGLLLWKPTGLLGGK